MNDREKWVRILGENMFTTDAYRDEPILRTAASMKNYMPPQYREMRRLALQNGARSRSAEEILYRQAKFMEDFEDEYDYGGDFVRYFPTYQSMSDMQMRGYFSWRTQVRRGSVRKTSLSFVFIYLYELINGIGWTDAADGFAKLQSFCETYMTLDARIFRYAQMWMRDFVIYYDLDPSLRAMYFPPETAQMRDVLRAWETADDDALFSALCACSSYNLERSRFYRVCAQPIRAVTCRAYRAWAEYYEKNRKFTLFEALIGKPFTTPYSMFSAAVFYPQPTHPDADVQIDACTSFCCRGGKWTYTRIWGSSEGARQIGMLLKAVDAAMRAQYAYEHPLKSAKAPAYLEKIIAKSIEQARQAQASRRSARSKSTLPSCRTSATRRTSRAAGSSWTRRICRSRSRRNCRPIPRRRCPIRRSSRDRSISARRSAPCCAHC